MARRATRDRQFMVESSDKTWSTGKGNGKLLQSSCLENPRNNMKRQKDRTLKDNSPGQQVPNMLLEKNGEITTERMNRLSQSRNTTQLWMSLVVKAKFNAVKTILYRNLEC